MSVSPLNLILSILCNATETDHYADIHPVAVGAWVQSHANPCKITDRVALDQDLLLAIECSPVSIIPPVLHTL